MGAATVGKGRPVPLVRFTPRLRHRRSLRRDGAVPRKAATRARPAASWGGFPPTTCSRLCFNGWKPDEPGTRDEEAGGLASGLVPRPCPCRRGTAGPRSRAAMRRVSRKRAAAGPVPEKPPGRARGAGDAGAGRGPRRRWRRSRRGDRRRRSRRAGRRRAGDQSLRSRGRQRGGEARRGARLGASRARPGRSRSRRPGGRGDAPPRRRGARRNRRETAVQLAGGERRSRARRPFSAAG